MSTPFVDREFLFTNPDGSQISVRGTGNQEHAVFESLDGFTVVKDPGTGFYCYAKPSDNQSELLSTGVRVGSADPKSLNLIPHWRLPPAAARVRAMAASKALGPQRRWEIRRERARTELKQVMAALTAAPQPAPQPAPPGHTRTGTYVGLCLLVQFPDVAGTITQPQVNDFCNKAGYTGFGNNGSVYDYFFDVSGGRLRYTNVVTTYYTAKHKRSYYTDPSVSYGSRARELIVEALDHLKAEKFNFAQLSSDSDGYVYALNVFYAGGTVNNWAEGLWPHSSALSTYDAGSGKKFSDYQITDIGSELTLGTFCHENGHMLCDFPDLYDYGYESTGSGSYCLMAYGGSGKNPTQVSAYLKYKAGWASKTTPITPGLHASLPVGKNEFYIYTHPGHANEYFIIENRQQLGRDKALPCSGLAIWHVDELGSNNQEQMSDSSHYECALEQADNRFDLEHGRNSGDSGDLFAAPKATRFTDTTSPASKWWDGGISGMEILDISASDVTMTFRVEESGPMFAKQLCVDQNKDGRLEVFYVGTDQKNYHNWQVQPNSGWAGGSAFSGLAKQIAVGRNADGRLEVFYVGTNNLIYHNWQIKPNGGWAGEAPFGGVAKQIAVGRNADGRLEVFYVGTDNHVYHNWQVSPNSGWAGQAALGGSAKQIAVGSNADGRLEVFYVGTNDYIYHNWQVKPNSGWAGQAALEGLAKQIVVGKNADGRLEIFYVGTNDHIYHNWQVKPNSGWAGEDSMGGAAQQIAVGNNADGRLEIFYIGTNDHVYHNWQVKPNSTWAGEKALGGAGKKIAVGRNADGRLEVFYVGTNSRLYHNWQVKPNSGWAGEALLL